MEQMSLEFALIGMILVGIGLCLVGFWLEVRRRRNEQRQEAERQHFFRALHMSGDLKLARPGAVLGKAHGQSVDDRLGFPPPTLDRG
jgi:hypothetical protein